MTRDEFYRKFQGRMLLFMAEAWAVRKEKADSLGLVMDQHAHSLKELMREMYDAMQPETKAPQNGAVTTVKK